MPVPPGLDELDAAVLTTLLRRHDPTVTAEVLTVRAEPIGVSSGFLGQLRRLHITYRSSPDPDSPARDHTARNHDATRDESGRVHKQWPATLVAKAPTQDPGGRKVGAMLNVWARESRFFADLAPGIAVAVPRCYANEGDPATQQWLLLLQDAGDTAAPTQAHGATFDQVTAALTEIAKLHRQFSSHHVSIRPVSWLPGLDRGPFDALQHSVQAAVEPFAERFGDLLPTGGVDALRQFAPRLAAWADQQARGPLTVVHADYRLDNLIVHGPDPGPGAQGPVAEPKITVLDWQTTLMGGGEMDLSSFLVTSVALTDRRRWEDALIERYADAVGRSTDQVRRGYLDHLWWWMALYANNLSRIDPADERGTQMFSATVQRTFQAAADHGLFAG